MPNLLARIRTGVHSMQQRRVYPGDGTHAFFQGIWNGLLVSLALWVVVLLLIHFSIAS